MPAITRTTLTKRAVESAAATGTPYRLRDNNPIGLVLRVSRSGAKTWAILWGRGQERVFGRFPVMTLEHAREEAKKLLVDPRARTGKLDDETFGGFLDERYGPWVKAERRAGAATLANLKAQFAGYLKKPLSAITAWNIEKFKADRLRDGIKPATVNRDLIRIRACLAKAVEWGSLAEHPLRSVKQAKGSDDSRARYLSLPEEKRLRDALMKRDAAMRKARLSGNAWNAERGRETRRVWKVGEFPDHLHPLVLVAMNTGLRRGELFGLTWAHVDLKRALLTVRAATAKGQKTRHVPLNDEAVTALRAWKPKQADPVALIFASTGGGRMTNINKSWAALMTKAKLDDFRFHDLRHHFASRLVMEGVDLYTVKELLGHSDFEMTQRYAHLAPEHKAAAVEKLMR